jgi:hypothetical protein
MKRLLPLLLLSLLLSLSPSLLFDAEAAKTADHSGTWKWTTPNRNGQPVETVLKLEQAKDGTVTGTVTDRFGTRPISKAAFKGDQLTFSDVRDTPSGKAETAFTAKLTGDTLALTTERPDRAPAAAAKNATRKSDVTATRVPETPDPKPKG